MSVLPNDYDSDPGRFLSADQPSRDDVHPYVADRFAAAGARTVLDVGGGNGRLARLLPALGLRCLLIDASPAMLALAPRPSVRADGARLPVADESVDAVALLYTLYHYLDPLVPLSEARRVLKPGGLLAACAANRDTHPELAHVVPDWGAASTFDGEDAPAIVAEVFAARGDTVAEDRWDGTPIPLSTPADVAARLRIYGLTEEAAAAKAATVHLPLTLTARGCVVYATKSLLSRTNRGSARSLARRATSSSDTPMRIQHFVTLCDKVRNTSPKRTRPRAHVDTEASCPCTPSSARAAAMRRLMAFRPARPRPTRAAGWPGSCR